MQVPARALPPARRSSWRRLRLGLLFISPWLIGFLAFTLYPIVASLYYSFTQYDILTPPRFVGLRNYTQLLHDPDFRQAVTNQLYYVVLAVPLSLLAAFGLALLLNTNLRFRSVFRTIFFIPSITPVVAVALVWGWIYNSQYGLLNSLLNSAGFQSVPWLSSETLVKPSLIVVSLWGSGSTMIIFLAALQDVPQHLYEAARLDGASRLQELRYVTVPMVSPAILFNLITGMIGAFNYFTLPWVMTGGGPAGASTFYPIYLYNNAFVYYKMGYASAMAWIMFLITAVSALLVFRQFGRYGVLDG